MRFVKKGEKNLTPFAESETSSFFECFPFILYSAHVGSGVGGQLGNGSSWVVIGVAVGTLAVVLIGELNP